MEGEIDIIDKQDMGPKPTMATSSSRANQERSEAERREKLREELDGIVLTSADGRIGYVIAKRLFDIVFSLAVFAAFWWVYLIIALAIKIDDPKGPITFKQIRVGKDGELFTIHKFRTMCVDAEEKKAALMSQNEKSGPAFKMTDDPRITKVGKLLRKTSLDELPQFFDVLIGKLSIVGPRPLVKQEMDQCNEYQRQRLLVKPGITCYWQTRRNRDAISWDEWVDLDLLYVKNCSPWVDIKLIIQTVGVVLTAQGE